MLNATTPAGRASKPDPSKGLADKPIPDGIANLLAIVQILLGYGQHLAATLESRAGHRSFALIARCFGTASPPVILAHLTRGIRRAIALQRVLYARAARGRDLVVPPLRIRSLPRIPAEPLGAAADAQPDAAQGMDAGADGPSGVPGAGADAQPASPETAAAPLDAIRRRRRAKAEEPLDIANLPSVAELEAQIRRRPLGRALADIGRDFGVLPGLCTGWFWNRMFEALTFYDGGLATYLSEMFDRRRNFSASDAAYHPDLDWPDITREDTSSGLGFFIGEPPVNPYTAKAPAAAPDIAGPAPGAGPATAGPTVAAAGPAVAAMPPVGAPARAANATPARAGLGTGPP